MIPLPPGVIPPNFLPGAPPPNTPEGQHLMRTFIMEQQQRAFQQQQMGMGGGHSNNNNNNSLPSSSSSFSFPLFPPGMSEEDIHEFMQDPENQGKIKVNLAWHDIYTVYMYTSIDYQHFPTCLYLSAYPSVFVINLFVYLIYLS